MKNKYFCTLILDVCLPNGIVFDILCSETSKILFKMKTILSLPMNIFRVIINGITNVFSYIIKQIRLFFESFSLPMATSVLSVKGLIFAVVVGLFVAILAVGVQPFGLSEFSHPDKTLYLIGFGVVAFVGMLFAKFVLPFVLKGFYNEETWTVGRQVIHVAFILLLVSVLMIVYSNTMKIKEFDLFDAVIVLAIGIIPAVILSITQQRVYQTKFLSNAESINSSLDNLSLPQPKQVFPVMVFGKQLSIVPNQLIYAETSANATTFHYQTLTGLEKKTVNMAMNEVEKELSTYPQFVRIHKDFIVNLNGIQKVHGNARGYKLNLARVKEEIAVVRKYHGVLEKI